MGLWAEHSFLSSRFYEMFKSNFLPNQQILNWKHSPLSSWICVPMVLAWHGHFQSLLLGLSGNMSWDISLPELWLWWWDTVEFGAEILCIWKPWTQAPSFSRRTLIILGGCSSITLVNRTWFPSVLRSVAKGNLTIPFLICIFILFSMARLRFQCLCTSFFFSPTRPHHVSL